MPNPTAPLTLWILLSFLASAAMFGVPLLLTLRSHRHAMNEWRLKDETDSLRLRLDEPIIQTKILALSRGMVDAAISAHNDAMYVHPSALLRYPNIDQFNSVVQSLRGEIGGIRDLIEAGEKHRATDVQDLRTLINNAAADRKAEFNELRRNVARAVGDKGLAD